MQWQTVTTALVTEPVKHRHSKMLSGRQGTPYAAFLMADDGHRKIMLSDNVLQSIQILGGQGRIFMYFV